MIHPEENIHAGLQKLAQSVYDHPDFKKGVSRLRLGNTLRDAGAAGIIGTIPLSLVKNPMAQKLNTALGTAGAVSYLSGLGLKYSGKKKLKRLKDKLRSQ